MRIDERLLLDTLDQLARIGAEPEGGTYRPLYGDAWAQAVARVSEWMRSAGLTVRQDAVGNVWGRLDGKSPGKSVVTGSHIDTVRRGGRLDGALGIVAGLVAVRALAEQFGKPSRPLEVVALCEEEGSRFATNFWGSRAVAGAIEPGEAERVTDEQGVTIAAAMRERGFDPAAIASAARADLDAWVELHIEQGAVLETQGITLAVVQAICGAAHVEVTVTGRPDHAGTTPMDLRHDALVAAAAMVQTIEELARAMGRPAVATVGKLQVSPGQANVVPGAVTFVVDLRHTELEPRRQLGRRIAAACRAIAERRGLGIAIRTLQERPPVPMDDSIRALLTDAAKAEGVTPLDLPSGAGHDAQVLAVRCRAGMLFVPSIGGRSHCPEEATDPAHLALGTRVLARALKHLAY